MIITDAEIISKLSHKVRPLRSGSPEIKYIKAIAKRFDDKYQLNLFSHIKTITKVGYVIAQGFYFVPVSSSNLVEALLATKKFHPDDKNSLVGCLASYATNGTGYREQGQGKDQSLHCDIASNECSVHLDETAFKSVGPYGSFYNPDAGQHIVFDLGWDDKLVRPLYEWKPGVGRFFDRITPNFLHSSTKYSKYGASLDFHKSDDLTIQLTYARSFNMKKFLSNPKGFYKTKEQSIMFTISGTHTIGN